MTSEPRSSPSNVRFTPLEFTGGLYIFFAAVKASTDRHDVLFAKGLVILLHASVEISNLQLRGEVMMPSVKPSSPSQASSNAARIRAVSLAVIKGVNAESLATTD